MSKVIYFLTLVVLISAASASAATKPLKACLKADGSIVIKASCKKAEKVLTSALLATLSPATVGVTGATGPAGPSIGLVTSSNTGVVPGANFSGFPPVLVPGTVTVQADCPASHLLVGVVCRKASGFGSANPSDPVLKSAGKGAACTFTNPALSLSASGEVLIQCLPF